MKLNKMTLIAALALGGLLTLGNSVNAQEAASTNSPAMTPPAGGPGGRARLNAEAIIKQLEVSDDLKPKVKAILDDQMQKMKDLRADSSLSTEDRRAKNKTIRDEATAKLKVILTPEQFAKYQKLMQGGRRNAPATPPAAN